MFGRMSCSHQKPLKAPQEVCISCLGHAHLEAASVFVLPLCDVHACAQGAVKVVDVLQLRAKSVTTKHVQSSQVVLRHAWQSAAMRGTFW